MSVLVFFVYSQPLNLNKDPLSIYLFIHLRQPHIWLVETENYVHLFVLGIYRIIAIKWEKKFNIFVR